jgi:hypothetical protein
MATQKIQSLVKNREKTIERLFTTPANKLTPGDLRLLGVALTFGDGCYTDKVDLGGDNCLVRDLRSYHSLQNWDELCTALCLVKDYNAFDPVKTIEALSPHKALIQYGQGGHTQFGREYSPVLYLDMKYSYNPKEDQLTKVKALVKDLKEVAEADEIHWSISGKTLHGNFNKEDLTWWACVRDDEGEVASMEKRVCDHIGTLRIWWD